MSNCNFRAGRLYKFREGKYNEDGRNRDLDTVANNYLWFSYLKDLNDPLEGVYEFIDSNFSEETALKLLEGELEKTGLNKENIAKEIKKLKEESNKQKKDIVRLRTVKFLQNWINNFKDQQAIFSGTLGLGIKNDSENPGIQNKQMWTHYANEFKGFCIEYDIEETVLSIEKNVHKISRGTINYQNIPPKIHLTDFIDKISNNELPKDSLISTIYNKHLSWQIENEYRLTSKSDGKHHHSKNSINRILLGNRASEKLRYDLISLCRSKKIDLYEILPDTSTYNLNRYKLETL